MNIKRALKLRQQAQSAYNDIFSCGRHYGLSHAAMLERRGKVLDSVAKCPRWVKAYLEGYWQCLQDQAYRHDLVYGAIINGQFYSTHSNRDDYYEKHGIEARDYANNNPTKGHYWSENLKPFFTSAN